jgi:hypothetical protein
MGGSRFKLSELLEVGMMSSRAKAAMSSEVLAWNLST